MKNLISTFAILALVPAAYAADMKQMEGMHMDHKGMKDMPKHQHQAAQTASATGTVKSVNAEKGTITISHGPVTELNWPAMVMGFAATPELIAQIDAGDDIAFTFVSKDNKYRIESIEKR